MADIQAIWKNIVENQGETFFTVKMIAYTYHVRDNYICLENTNRNIPKGDVERALTVVNPTTMCLNKMNLQGHSYLWGIITDSRIIKK